MPENASVQPDQDQGNVEAPQTKSAPVKMSEYVVSWRWLLGGLLLLLIAGSAIGGTYYYRYINLSRDVMNVAQQMRDEGDEFQKKNDLPQAAQKWVDATNLLLDFNRKQPGNVSVLKMINGLLESLYETDAGSTMRARRAAMLMNNCGELITAMASDKESLPYRTRIMDLEWEQGNLTGVLDRAKEVLRIDQQVYNRENYDALRYVTLVTLLQLPSIGYQTIQVQFNLPPTMDELLEKVLQMGPDNVEIAYRYAEFIVDVNNRDEFRKSASPKLREMAQDARIKMAQGIIDDMVSRNANNVRAYLVRYQFKSKYIPSKLTADKIDPDLQSVLDLDPDDADGLILAGMYAYRQSTQAFQEGNAALSEERKKLAETYLKRVVEKKPNVDLGYQYLGDFYVREGKLDEAIRIWNEGVERNRPLANPELVGRLVVALTDQKKFEEASDKVALLNRFVQESRFLSPEVMRQIRSLASLLNARLYAAEGTEAIVKAEEAQGAGRTEESRRLFSLAQRRTSDATQILEQLLGSFGNTSHDYVLDNASIYSRLLGESLMLAGRLMSEQAKWDRAVFYFQAAMPFPQFRQQAAISAANAYQQQGKSDESVRLLAEVAERSPDSMPVQYLYAQSLFRQQLARNTLSASDLEAVEERFRFLQEHAAELPNPWTIDLRLIHLEMVREGLSNDPERILKAQQTAIRKFRALEKKEFPFKDGEKPEDAKKTYSDDLGFLSELSRIYSELAQLSDFDRVLQKIRELPNGEAVYYSERINDALRRNDRDGATQVVEEALASEILSASQKQPFVTILENLKSDEPNSLDKVYARLKTSFDQNPDSLKPQAFFLLANMALDRDDVEYAKVLEERLRNIEGEANGTMWRFIKARMLLMQKDPPFDVIRQLQDEILQRRGDWDMTYLLKASIEERFLVGKQDTTEIKKSIIESYQMAIRCGNTQPQVWNRLLAMYEEAGRAEDAQKLQRDALIRGIRLEASPGQFPQPYQRMYTQVHELLQDDPQNADVIARQCMVLAEGRHEKPDLIFSLNLAFGKLFLDAGLTDSAQRHLRVVADRGGTYVYPLAVAMAKARMVDEGFNLILDEIDRMPSSMGTLIPSLLILLSQVRPSETVFQRIDKLMIRIENGERQVLKGKVDEPNEESFIPLGERRLKTLLVRFPGSTQTPDPATIELISPDNQAHDESEPVPNE